MFGACDSCVLKFEFYVFVFGLYCFGLAGLDYFQHT